MTDVLVDCGAEEDGFLRYEGHAAAEVSEIEGFDVMAVEGDLALYGVVETFEELDDG